MKKKAEFEDSDMDFANVSAEEFKFILHDMRLRNKTIVLNSEFSRNTLWNDFKTSKNNNSPIKAYWVTILINLIGEIPFKIARNNYRTFLKKNEINT